ncbi:MAG: hypothetical protein JXA11_05830, partial [Phycisphaerae bacterium]|nr:hypothetical protein [Phycisphaerae bacterium]
MPDSVVFHTRVVVMMLLGMFSAMAATAETPPSVNKAEDLLPRLPKERGKPGKPLSAGLFWLGAGDGWAAGPHAEEAIRFFHRYVPNLALVVDPRQPGEFTIPPVCRELGIPVVAQKWGHGYQEYFKSAGAFEIDWHGRVLDSPSVCELAGNGHATAMPHPATRKFFTRYAQAAIRAGFSGYGYCDMVWMWGAGRGRSGYNPATIRAFRLDLQGRDEGLLVSLDGNAPKRFHLADYARFYLGGMIEPGDLGLKDWAEYSPTTARQAEKNPERYNLRHQLLFDLLCHYEWLKFAQTLGDTCRREGGVFQCMTNPEDMANGGDFLFGGGLESVQVMSEEFFRGPRFLDGAYFRFPYLRGVSRSPRQAGVVMESGVGGNLDPYYEPELAYAVAYELTLATEADMFEGDFWPGNDVPWADVLRQPDLCRRIQVLLAFGLAFQHARADAARREDPQFLSVTARRIFRPWGEEWIPWDWRLDNPLSPEELLAWCGFVFEGVGEEALQTCPPPKVLLYTPAPPTEQGWRRVTELLAGGQTARVVTVAQAMEYIVTRRFDLKPFSDVFPEVQLRRRDKAAVRGRLIGPDGAALDERVYSPAGDLWVWEGGEAELLVGNQPIVARKTVGKGVLYLLLFDPTSPKNQPLGRAVYEHLLAKDDIHPLCRAEKGVMVRLYQKDDVKIVGVQHPEARVDRDWVKGGPGNWSPYHITALTPVAVRTSPNAKFDWVSLPGGRHGQAAADAKGWTRLELQNTSHEVFFLRPQGPGADAWRETLLSRKSLLLEVLTLGKPLSVEGASVGGGEPEIPAANMLSSWVHSYSLE